MRLDNKYEAVDRGALRMALLALHTCPTCREDLQPATNAVSVWGCAACRETWYIPEETGHA